jgi:hypothetical protein
MADAESTRKAFEDAVFNRRFRASIKRNPYPPQGFGGLDFVSTGCPTQAELCRRDEDGDYADEAVSAMWWGWQQALAHGVRGTPVTNAMVEAALTAYVGAGINRPAFTPMKEAMRAALNAAHGVSVAVDQVQPPKPSEAD